MTDVEAAQREHDLIVLGAGAAGMAAACTAAALGARVLLVESSPRVGGTTAISGGMIWVPANHKMIEAGLPDSLEQAREYLRATVPGAGDDARLEAFLQRGDEAIRFLESRTALELRPVRRYPDYYPTLPGATTGGRVLEPLPYDGRALGSDFALLRDPLPEYMLFGGMMVSRDDLPLLRKVDRSPRALWHAARLYARYLSQRRHAHRGTSLVLGNALVARLLESVRKLDVALLTSTQVKRLAIDDGRVVGVVLDDGRGERAVRARRGVVLATGGLSHQRSLRQRYVPPAAGELSATVDPQAARGGAELALDAGACLSPPPQQPGDALALWVPVSVGQRRDGSRSVFPHTVTDRSKPGLIAVNRDGVRFANEAVSYHEFVRSQLRNPDRNVPAWLVCDRRFLWKYGLGRVRPFALSLRADLASGYLHRGRTLPELAASIGVPGAAFVQTVEGFNEGARRGEDPQFGRGADAYQRHLGDAEHRPNPCVAPIVKPPFYAIAVVPADLGMAAGLMTDEQGRVTRSDGSPIEGLYACGNDMHSVMNGAYPGPGITIGPALVFGYVAARHACGDERSSP